MSKRQIDILNAWRHANDASPASTSAPEPIIDLNGRQMIEFHWDDETDPQNSLGWVASIDGQEWTPVGQNMAEYYPTLDGLLRDERNARLAEWRDSTLDGAIADARDYFHDEVVANA